MKQRTYIFLVSLIVILVIAGGYLTFIITKHHREKIRILNQNVYRVMHVCQCRNCMLHKAQLANFKPGSQLTLENIFYQDNPYTDTKSKYVDDGGWMSCDLSQADLSRANLTAANFTVNLRGYVTPLAKVDFSGANFDQAILTNATLYGDDFNSAKITNANLANADLSMANFEGADFSGSNLTNAISTADAMHGWGANMHNTKFVNADLTGANIYADFIGADFSHAKLTNAQLSTSADAVAYAENKNIDDAALFSQVNFSYANLKGATFKNTAQNKDADITQATFCQTVMPDGTVNNRDCKK